MDLSPFPRWALSAILCFATVSIVCAEDTTPPYVNKPLKDQLLSTTSPKTISLKKTFKLTGVTGELVHFTTNAGDMDVELFSDKTPKTVAAFLKGASATDATSYNNSLIQRSVPNFIIQGGGFYIDSANTINAIGTRPSIPSEAGIKNTRGTVAMALSNGPDSGVGDFFFNLIDNAILDDTSDGGPFTVFGRVVGDLATMDKIAALPIRDLSSSLNGAFTNVPLLEVPASGITVSDFVTVKTITSIPLVPKSAGTPSVLKLKVKNSNHGSVTAQIVGHNLVLTPVAGATTGANIRVIARNKATGVSVTASFRCDFQ